MKKVKIKFLWLLIVGFCLLSGIKINAQALVASSNHYQGTKSIEILGSLGQNNMGGGLAVGYYLRDNFNVRAYGIYRQFEFKSYSENIIESGIEGGFTLFEGDMRGRRNIFSNFNFSLTAGVSIELVKTTSRTVLIDPYPRYVYAVGGGVLEYTITRSFALNAYGRQFYAVNGSDEELGRFRYDYGLGLKMYF